MRHIFRILGQPYHFTSKTKWNARLLSTGNFAFQHNGYLAMSTLVAKKPMTMPFIFTFLNPVANGSFWRSHPQNPSKFVILLSCTCHLWLLQSTVRKKITTIPCEPNTANKLIKSHIFLHKFVPVLATFRLLSLKFLELFFAFLWAFLGFLFAKNCGQMY